MKVRSSIYRQGLLLIVACVLSSNSSANEGRAFRVCADPNNLPLSAKSLDGLENKIAEIWAKKLGLPLQYTWFPQRRGFIRNTLKALNESGSAYKCDVVMGVAAGFDQLATTMPYYRSTYALVFVKGRGLDDVTSGRQFVNLNPEVRDQLKIGAFTPTPGVKWLARYGMTEQLVPFLAMSGDPEAYPGEIIEKELASGNLDAAIVWGPIAGFFAKRSEVEMVVIPLVSEPGIQFDFAISAGVRYGDGERKDVLEGLIRSTAAPMREVLEAYNVPLLDPVRATNTAQLPDDD
ncbi:MAG: quinoprotein dehydrogenase-associated putative ABC transporter substrate-binding protein [Gammaproteobacteria bacterium]|nr:quinoprotein dehydrogenase-associated putative ABC transporter substrate-binding protein [Gammaproteobacteria bacterium]